MPLFGEAKKAYYREYYQKNKEKILQQKKEWNETNPEKRKIIKQRYDQSPQGKKINTIQEWKRQGLIHADYETLYNNYIACMYCQICGNDFKSDFDRCLDHDHSTGLFRQFLCRACNNKDSWKKK